MYINDENRNFLIDALEKFCAEYEAEIEKLKNDIEIKNDLINDLEKENEKLREEVKAQKRMYEVAIRTLDNRETEKREEIDKIKKERDCAKSQLKKTQAELTRQENNIQYFKNMLSACIDNILELEYERDKFEKEITGEEPVTLEEYVRQEKEKILKYLKNIEK